MRVHSNTVVLRSGLVIALAIGSLQAQPTLNLGQTMCGTDSISATFKLPAAATSDALVELRSDPPILQFTDVGGTPTSVVIVKQNAKSVDFFVVTTGINPFQAPQDVTV